MQKREWRKGKQPVNTKFKKNKGILRIFVSSPPSPRVQHLILGTNSSKIST